MSGELQRVVGENLRRRRAGLGMTQAQFAQVLGINRGYVAGVERGERDISLNAVEKIARRLQLDPLELLQRAADCRAGTPHGAPARSRIAPRAPRKPISIEIYRFIAESPGHSRIELSELLPVHASTLGRAVRDLLEAGLIVEEPRTDRRNKAGRRPCSLRIAAPLPASSESTPARSHASN